MDNNRSDVAIHIGVAQLILGFLAVVVAIIVALFGDNLIGSSRGTAPQQAQQRVADPGPAAQSISPEATETFNEMTERKSPVAPVLPTPAPVEFEAAPAVVPSPVTAPRIGPSPPRNENLQTREAAPVRAAAPPPPPRVENKYGMTAEEVVYQCQQLSNDVYADCVQAGGYRGWMESTAPPRNQY